MSSQSPDSFEHGHVRYQMDGTAVLDSTLDDFNPVADLLVDQAVRPAHLMDVNLRALSPFQRSLLVIDGTVTKFVEAYAMEPIKVQLLMQRVHRLNEDHDLLQADEETRVIVRQVLLEGKYNHRLYAYAASLLIIDRLPSGVQEDLRNNPGGIGRVLIDHELETRREVLWYGVEDSDYLPPTVKTSATRFLSRAYRIMYGGRPIMMINEKFPIGNESILMHH